MKLEELLKPKYEVHIVCDKEEENIEIKGSIPSVLTALSNFVSALDKNGVPRNLIEYALKQGFMTEKELNESTKEKIDELIKKIL